MPRPDTAIAQEFLDLLAGGPGARFTFQTFDDDSLRDDGALVHVLHGTLDEVAPKLIDLNEAGAGIFVTVNETDGRGRTAANVTGLRALFIDKDDGAPGEFAMEPGLVIGREGDPDRWHAYWPLRPGEPLDLFTPAQKALIAHYRSDDKVKDLPRVLRLPGFLWRKKAPPQMVSILRRGPERRHTIEEVMRAHGAWPLPPSPERPAPEDGDEAESDVGGPPMAERVRRCRAYLETLPPSLSGGRGHDALFRAACECMRFGLGRGAAVGLLLEFWNERKTGIARGSGRGHRAQWTRKEIEHKVADAHETVRAKGEIGCRLRASRSGGRRRADPDRERGDDGARATGHDPLRFEAGGIVLVIENVRRTPAKHTVILRIALVSTGEDLGSFQGSTSKNAIRDAEREIQSRIRDTGRELGQEQTRDLRRLLCQLLDAPVLDHARNAMARAAAADEPPAAPSMIEIATLWLRETFEPAFVGTKGAVWSEKRGCSIGPSDAGNRVGPDLLAKLEEARDYVPASERDAMKPTRNALIAVRPAWAAVVASLPDELDAPLGPESRAAGAVRRRVLAALTTPETWSRTEYDGHAHTERASLSSLAQDRAGAAKIDSRRWSKPIRGLDCWLRIDAENRIRFGIRYTFLQGQVKGVVVERASDQKVMVRLLTKYGLLAEDLPDRVGGSGVHIAVLAPDVCDEALGIDHEHRHRTDSPTSGDDGAGGGTGDDDGDDPAGQTEPKP